MHIHEIHPVITGSHDLNLISKTPLRFLCSQSCIHFFVVHGNFCHSLRDIQYIVHFIYMKFIPFPKFLHESLVCPLHICLGTTCCHKRSSLLGSHILHNLFEYIGRNCHFFNNLSLIGNDSTVSCNKINIIFHRCKHSFYTVIFSAADSCKYNSLSLQLSDNVINLRVNIHGAFFQKCTIQI